MREEMAPIETSRLEGEVKLQQPEKHGKCKICGTETRQIQNHQLDESGFDLMLEHTNRPND